MNKIIYIKYSPLTNKVYEDYCMGGLLESGYDVQYWDVTNMFGIKLQNFESFVPESSLSIVKLDSYHDMNIKVSENKDALFISMMTCGIGQARMLRLLTKHHCKLAFWGPDPVYIPQKSVSSKISGITYKKVKTKLGNELMKLFFKTGHLHYYDYYFNVGKNGYKSLGVVNSSLLANTKPINISSSDYSNFIYGDSPKVLDGDYIVFIDQYFPFHPDFLICGVPTIPAEVYYKELNDTFKKIEEELNMKVVVAAHPKSLRYRDEDFFDGRKVFMGATCQLVKGASLVIAHDSTAIGYAIMSKKPIVLLTSAAMKRYLSEHDLLMRNFVSRFSFSLIDMDKVEPMIESSLLSVANSQLALYESYLYDYCTLPTICDTNEAIMLRFVDNYFNVDRENG